jgi:creatinine amidohydrolase
MNKPIKQKNAGGNTAEKIQTRRLTGMHEALKMTAHQYKEGGYDKAILALGSCEAHGQHLPLGTDTLVSYMLSCKVAEQAKGMLVLPPVAVGVSGHYAAFPFTLHVKADTMIAVIRDILRTTIQNGITRIFIFNGHDGNIAPIEIAAREVKMEYPMASIVALNDWWIAAGKLLPGDTFEVWDGLGHAGEGETSIALRLFPSWCQMQYAAGVVPDRLPPFMDVKWAFSELTNTAATGDPTKGTAEKGKKMEDVLVSLVVDTLRKLDTQGWDYRSSMA